MSNLGLYQYMTTRAKKMGGPLQFLCTVALGGYVAGRIAEAGGKAVIKTVTKRLMSRKKSEYLYTVHTEGTSNDGLQLAVGDKFHVLETDKDAVLIEVIGDANNPYFVSLDLLQSISDFDQ